MLLPHTRLPRNKRRYRHHYVDDDVIRLRYLGNGHGGDQGQGDDRTDSFCNASLVHFFALAVTRWNSSAVTDRTP